MIPDPYLNAKFGSNLTLDGIVECDIAVHIYNPSKSRGQFFGNVVLCFWCDIYLLSLVCLDYDQVKWDPLD
jgi:hypothetical protein